VLLAIAATLGALAPWFYARLELSHAKSAKPALEQTTNPEAPLVWRPLARPAGSGFVGTVTDADLVPIARARVCALFAVSEPTAPAPGRCTVTDEHGRWTLRELGPSSYRVAASAAGYTTARAEDGRALSPQSDPTELITIVLSRSGVALVGHVADATGGIVPHATVRAITWTTPATIIEVESDDDGRFELWLAAGPVTLLAQAPGYASANAFATAPSNDAELVLTPGGEIRGRVIAAHDERPLAGALVRVTPIGLPMQTTQRTAFSGPDGAFTVDSLEPNRYLVTAEADGARSDDDTSVAVGLGGVVDDITLRVSHAAQVDGRVVIAGRNAACPEGSVTLYPTGTATPNDPPRPTLVAEIEAEGRVHFGSVPRGRYGVRPECPNHIPSDRAAFVEAELDDIQGLSWEVVPASGLSIDVVDERGQPVPNAQLALILPPNTVDEGSVLMPYTANLEGHCDVPAALEPGLYKVGPRAGAKGEPIEIELRAGMGIVPVKLRFTGSGSIEMETRLPDGTPISSGLLVNAYPADETATFGSAIAGGQVAIGRYRIGPLSAGEYRVELNDGINPPFSFDSSETRVHVSAGVVSRLSLIVQRAAQIRGHVFDAQDQPVANALVRADYEPATDGFKNRIAHLMLRPNPILTDTQGQFSIPKLANGARFRVFARTYDGESAEAAGVTAGTSDLTLKLVAAGSKPDRKGTFAQLGE
jgi:hypothetical protein